MLTNDKAEAEADKVRFIYLFKIARFAMGVVS
jgi:hypothetical protein